MSLPKLVNVCQALDTKQCTSLKKFMLMHVGKTSDLYLILECIIKEKNNLKSSKDVEDVAKKCEVKCSHKTFMNSLSQLYLYAEDWIALSQLNENKYEKDLLIQQWYNKNGLYNLSDQLVTKNIKEINTSVHLDYLQQKYKSEMVFENFFSNNPIKYQFNFEMYESMIISFEEYTSAMYLLYLSELRTWEEIAHKNLSHLKERILKKINVNEKTELLDALFNLYQLLDNEDFQSFEILRMQLMEGKFKKQSKLHYIVASNVINRCMRFWTKRIHSDQKMLHDLNNYGLEQGVFFSNGKLPSATFHNIVVRLTPINDYEIMKKFIDKWIDKVHSTNLEATKALAYAQISFYTKNYNDILKHTWRGDFDNFNQKNIAQSLHLLACFIERKSELKRYQNILQASISFVKRNKTKMSKHLYNSYNNFFTFLKLYDKTNNEPIINIDDYNPLLYRTFCEELIMKK